MYRKIIFLSGPMSGIPREMGLEWRRKATTLLNDKVFLVLHAYRGRLRKNGLPDPILDPRMAIARDKQDILRSSVLLVNDTFSIKKYPSANMIGTAMEVLFAFENNIPVIVFGKERIGNYWFDGHSHLRVDGLEKACKYINLQFIK